MKNLLLVFTLFLSTQSLQAQNWFEPDDKWVYRYGSWEWAGYSENGIIEDTLIDGIQAKIMRYNITSVSQANGDSGIWLMDQIVFENNDSIFYYLEGNGFNLIYDFTMNIGDTLTLYGADLYDYFTCEEPTYYVLDSLSELVKGQDTLAVQHMTFYDTHWDWSQSIINVETIGCTSGTFIRDFNHVCVFDLPYFGFCEFSNDNWEYKEGEEDCYDLPSSLDPEILRDDIKIYPNPATNMMYIDTEEEPSSVSIYNPRSEKIAEYTSTNAIDISHLPKGLYFLKITIDSKYILKKFMVH